MKKKILFAIPTLDSGGAEKVLTEIVKALDHSRYEIFVFTLFNQGVYREEIGNSVNYYFAFNISKKDDAISKLVNRIKRALVRHLPAKWFYCLFIKKEKYDVEIAFLEGWITKFLAASDNKSAKKIAWIHTDLIENPHADFAFKNSTAHEEAYRSYDKIICVSEQVKCQFESKFSNLVKERSSLVYYNPVDRNEILKQAELPICEKEWDENKFNIVVVGRLEPVKGQERLIRVLNELIDSETKFCVHFLGEGTQREELQNMSQALIAAGRCQFWGYQKNPYRFIGKADLCVCPSYAEGFSLIVVEALVLNRLVLATNCAGPAEVLENGKYGYLCENSEEGIKNALEKIMENTTFLKEKYRTNEVSWKFDIVPTIERIEKELLEG